MKPYKYIQHHNKSEHQSHQQIPIPHLLRNTTNTYSIITNKIINFTIFKISHLPRNLINTYSIITNEIINFTKIKISHTPLRSYKPHIPPRATYPKPSHARNGPRTHARAASRGTGDARGTNNPCLRHLKLAWHENGNGPWAERAISLTDMGSEVTTSDSVEQFEAATVLILGPTRRTTAGTARERRAPKLSNMPPEFAGPR